MLEIVIYDKYLMFKAISPRDNEVTTYKYDINGVTTNALHNITDPTPIGVRMSRKYKLENFVFDFDAVKLDSAPSVGQKALARLNLAGGKVTYYNFDGRRCVPRQRSGHAAECFVSTGSKIGIRPIRPGGK